MCDGFFSVLALPSPNDQLHDVGLFVELSVNTTVNGAVPEVGVPTKFAIGIPVLLGENFWMRLLLLSATMTLPPESVAIPHI